MQVQFYHQPDGGLQYSVIYKGRVAIKASRLGMKLKDPIGKIVDVWGKNKKIIGVVKDFHFSSLYKKVTPFFFRCYQDNRNIFVKIRSGKEKETIAAIEKFYKQFNQGLPFEFKFLDEDYQALYASEQRVAVLSRYFASIAIIISCLGLFGLAAFTAQKRQKEIGIRKVLGATSVQILTLITYRFVTLILISLVIGLPLSAYLMDTWLSRFAYQAAIGWFVFAVSALLLLTLTCLTIAIESIQAALKNPVEAIRHE